MLVHRHFYFRSTSVFSALEVCYENALYKFTFDIDIDIDIEAGRHADSVGQLGIAIIGVG